MRALSIAPVFLLVAYMAVEVVALIPQSRSLVAKILQSAGDGVADHGRCAPHACAACWRAARGCDWHKRRHEGNTAASTTTTATTTTTTTAVSSWPRVATAINRASRAVVGVRSSLALLVRVILAIG